MFQKKRRSNTYKENYPIPNSATDSNKTYSRKSELPNGYSTNPNSTIVQSLVPPSLDNYQIGKMIG